MIEEVHHYTHSLHWLEGRKGRLDWEEEGKPGITVATPPEFAGGVPGIISPEDLFVAAVNACIMTTFLSIAERKRIDLRDYRATAAGTLEKTEHGFMFSRVDVNLEIVVADEKDVKAARKTAELADRHCLVSRSLRSEVAVEANIVVEK